MKLKLFLTIAGIFAVLFGLSFLLIPVQLNTLYGEPVNEAGLFGERYLGSTYIGIGAILWLARKGSSQDGIMKAILLGYFILTVIGFIVALFHQFSGVGNSLVWSAVVVYLLLAVGAAYFRFGKGSSE